jgi:hypothetical protein
MTPEQAAKTLRLFASGIDTSRADQIDAGIIVRSFVDVRSNTPTRAEGVLRGEFEFQRGGSFGILRTAGDLAGAAMPFMLEYNPETQMFKATVQGTPRNIDFFFEAKGTLALNASDMGASQATVGIQPPTIGAMGTDLATRLNFGFAVAEQRTFSERTLTATAFGLPGRLEPVVDCDSDTTSISMGTRLRMNFEMKLAVKVIDRVVVEADSEAREIGLSLINGNIPTGAISRSESEVGEPGPAGAGRDRRARPGEP